jgi:hypothetical protein
MGCFPTFPCRNGKAAGPKNRRGGFFAGRGIGGFSARDTFNAVADIAEIPSETAGGAAAGAEESEEGKKCEGEGGLNEFRFHGCHPKIDFVLPKWGKTPLLKRTRSSKIKGPAALG